VFTVVVKQIDVMARQCLGQTRTQFGGKNLMPQALRFPNFIEMLRPADFNGALHTPRQIVHTGNN
jgi:hypothetical protein